MSSNESAGTNGTSAEASPEPVTLAPGESKLLPAEVAFDLVVLRHVVDEILFRAAVGLRDYRLEYDNGAELWLQATVNGNDVKILVEKACFDSFGRLSSLLFMVSDDRLVPGMVNLATDAVADCVFIHATCMRGAWHCTQKIVATRHNDIDYRTSDATYAEYLFERDR